MTNAVYIKRLYFVNKNDFIYEEIAARRREIWMKKMYRKKIKVKPGEGVLSKFFGRLGTACQGAKRRLGRSNYPAGNERLATALLMIICVLALIFSYAPVTKVQAGGLTPAAEDEEIAEIEPYHRKYVTPQADGTYNISLEISGDEKTVDHPADIVILFDTSSSTSREMIKCFQAAANKLADTFLSEANAAKPAAQQTRIGIVDFSHYTQDICAPTADYTTVKEAIKGIQVFTNGTQYTDWGAPLARSQEILEAAEAQRPGTKKYTIFLTDGSPNSYDGKTNQNTFLALSSAISKAKALLASDVTLYAIAAIDPSGNTIMHETLMSREYTNYSAGDANKFFYDATRDEEYESDKVTILEYLTRKAYLTESGADKLDRYYEVEHESEASYEAAFTEIADNITQTHRFSMLDLRDTLSDYVELTEDVDPTGVLQKAWLEKQVGEVVEVLPKDSYTVTYDAVTKTVGLKYNATLESGAVYRLNFNVTPAQKAYDELAENRKNGLYAEQEGYPVVGAFDPAREPPVNPGFYANDRATLTYTYTNQSGEAVENARGADFEKPVFQVELGSIGVEKKWENDDPQKRPDSVEITLLQDGRAYGILTLGADENGWSGSFTDLPGGPTGHVYTLGETTPAGYSASFDRNDLNFQGLAAQRETVILTNRATTANLNIHKTDPTGAGLGGAVFELYRVGADGTAAEKVEGLEITIGENGYAVVADLPFGDYLLVEVKAPQGYLLLAEPRPISFTTPDQVETVVNYPAPVLPYTGGRGSSLFVLLGCVIIVIGGGLLRNINMHHLDRRRQTICALLKIHFKI